MNKITLLAIGLLITAVSCVPAPTSTPFIATQAPPVELAAAPATATPAPTTAPTKAPGATETPEATATATWTAQQKFENWMNSSQPVEGTLKSVKLKYATAMGLNPNTIQTITKKVDGPNGTFAKIVDQNTGVALFISTQGKDGSPGWVEATPGLYWFASGKLVGANLNNGEFQVSRGMLKNFSSGILATEEQIRTDAVPYRLPTNARTFAAEAQRNEMSLFYHYMAEPGRFPSDINAGNIDQWLDKRFQDTISVVASYKTPNHPAYISFNEAWENDVWNPAKNPIRDKYGENWIGEYTCRLLSQFVSAGLNVNKEFVVTFNEANIYNRPQKQDLVFKTLAEARKYAFDKLASDPTMKNKLQNMGMNNAEDILIMLGTETHTKLESLQDDGSFWPAPTDSQFTAFLQKAPPNIEVVMTEINPFGTDEQKERFLKRMATQLRTKANFKGMIFWNVFFDVDDRTPQYPLSADPLLLFNYKDETPTRLYYALLGE